MRICAIFILLFTLTGCEILGAIIHDEKYTLNIHETPNVTQGFGYYKDHDYVGYGISGRFGMKGHPHSHSDLCEHLEGKNSSENH